MSILGTFTKQPADEWDYDLDYNEWLTAGDNVQNASVTVAPTGSLVVDSVFINDPRVKVWVSGGTNGVTYKLTVTMSSADGRIKQDEFKLRVKEV